MAIKRYEYARGVNLDGTAIAGVRTLWVCDTLPELESVATAEIHESGVVGADTYRWNGATWGAAGGGVTDDSVYTNAIQNDAVTYAKIQDVSATDKLLGRSTAGGGVVEEIACTAAGRALLDDADNTAQRTTLGLGTLATQSGTFSGTSSGTNTGDQTLPVKASGAEVDTGTDDAKFVTAKAIEDSAYIKAAYADAKVADAINDGTTGVAPSQNAVFDALALKQATLVSATNIKTINGASVLGAGDLAVGGGGARSVGITIDGAGSALTTGVKGFVQCPVAGTITRWTLVADQAGSAVVDVWKSTYAGAPPTVANTIAGSEKPTLAAAQKNEDTTLSTWTTAVAAGDVFGFNVDSAATVTRVTLVIWITPS